MTRMATIETAEPAQPQTSAGASRPECCVKPGEAVAAEDLVLLAVATGLKPAGGWQAAGVTNKQVAQLKKSHAARLGELRTLAALGQSYSAPLLTDLLKARVAQRLLSADSAAELERLAKITERLPETMGRASVPAKQALKADADACPAGDNDPNADVDSMSLDETLAEAKRLIALIEDEQHD